MNSSLARWVSVAGHPAVLMPVAAGVAAPAGVAGAALAVSLVCAGLVVAYSFGKARRGEWSHIDASAPLERAQLTSRAGGGLLAAAGILWLIGIPVGVSIVVGLSGLVVLAGHLLQSVAKLSLHVAFAVFATCLVWPNQVAAAGLAAVAFAVAWSRLALRRHVPRDILLGALIGAVAGGTFHWVMEWIGPTGYTELKIKPKIDSYFRATGI